MEAVVPQYILDHTQSFQGLHVDEETGMEFLGVSGITFPWHPEKEKSDVSATWKTHSSTYAFLNESSTGIQKGFHWHTQPVMGQ